MLLEDYVSYAQIITRITSIFYHYIVIIEPRMYP